MKNTDELSLDFERPSKLNDFIYVSLFFCYDPCCCISCFLSECQTNYNIIPKVVPLVFVFLSECVLDVHPPGPRRSPCLQKATTHSTLAGAARSSPLKTSSTWVSLSQFHHYCVHSWNGSRSLWALWSEDSCRPDTRPFFLSLTLWTSHEHSWPSPSQRTHVCVGFYCQSLWDCSLVF